MMGLKPAGFAPRKAPMSRWRILTVLGAACHSGPDRGGLRLVRPLGGLLVGRLGLGPDDAVDGPRLGAGLLLAAQQDAVRPVNFEPNVRWTERDQQAWKLVEARATAAKDIDADKLSDPQVLPVRRPGNGPGTGGLLPPPAKDPVGNLTVPEVLAVVELASHDLAEMVDKYLPGGHLLTINDWKRARKAVDWYQSASNVYWVASALISPINTGLRYAATQMGLTTPLQMLQENLLLWFYTAFLQRLGTYLIELNSGRLSVGATRYRRLVERRAATGSRPAAARRRRGRPGAPGDGDADGSGQGGQVEHGQRPAGRTAGADGRTAGHRRDHALRVQAAGRADEAGAAGHGRLRP